MFEAHEHILNALEFAQENNMPAELIAMLKNAEHAVTTWIDRETMDEYSFADFEIENAVLCKTIQLPPF
jgi:hypothetical protein